MSSGGRSCAADDAAVLQALIAAAEAQCRAWPTLAPDRLHELVRALILKVPIGTSTIAIALSKAAWRARLLPGTCAPRHQPTALKTTVLSSPYKRGRSAVAGKSD